MKKVFLSVTSECYTQQFWQMPYYRHATACSSHIHTYMPKIVFRQQSLSFVGIMQRMFSFSLKHKLIVWHLPLQYVYTYMFVVSKYFIFFSSSSCHYFFIFFFAWMWMYAYDDVHKSLLLRVYVALFCGCF